MAAYDLSKLSFVKEGKVKRVYASDGTSFLFEFTDKISVFDQVIPSLVPDKGETLQKCSAYWFKVAKQSKEHVRQHYRRIGHHDRLQATRKENKRLKNTGIELLPEPEIPALPTDMIRETSELYCRLMRMITGEN